MIHVKVLKAENLLDTKKKISKTKIYCFASSSRSYYIDSFKTKEKAANPHFNGEFDVDLFRASNLSFTIFSSKLLSKGKKKFIGRVDIDLCKLLTEDAGKKILDNPKSPSDFKFPITSCDSKNAALLLSISYIPHIYKSIDFNDISKPTIHFWVTYNPPIKITEKEKSTVEIELLQADPINDRKSGDLNVLYTNFNKSTTWNSVGNSSSNQVIPFPDGYSQVDSFKLSRIAGKYEFFLINVNDYKGIVTLNFIEEKRGKSKKFKDDSSYIIPKSGKDNIGTVKTVNIQVEANKQYCLPFFMFYDKKFLQKTMNFVSFPTVSCDNSNVNSNHNDYSDEFSSKVPFLKKVMSQARKSIRELKNVNFIRVNALPNTESVSLSKTIKDYNVPTSNTVRFYISGSTKETQNQDQNSGSSSRSSSQLTETDYWEPFFIVYDSNTGQKCQDISKQLQGSPIKDSKFPNGKDFLGLKCHTTVTFNLDKIGTDKIVVFGIHCKSALDSSKPTGFFLISHLEQDKETLIFREPVYADPNSKSHYAVCLRFVYQDNEWRIVPIRQFFTEEKDANSYLDTLNTYKWSIPDSMICQSSGIINNL